MVNTREKIGGALRGLSRDPFDLIRIAGIAVCTLKVPLRQAAFFGAGNRIINAANVRIGAASFLFRDSIYIRAASTGRVTMGDPVAIKSFS